MPFFYSLDGADWASGLRSALVVLTCAGMAVPLAAQDAAREAQTGDSTALVNRLLECRAITDAQARLACFDTAAVGVATARSSGDLLIADRTEVQATRETNFGARADRGPWADEPEVKERTFVVKSLQQTQGMLFIFVMEDGSVWQQTESVIMRRPKPGDQVLVKAGAMGGFMGKVNDGRQFRIKRVR